MKFKAITARLTTCFLIAGLIFVTLVEDSILVTAILTSCQMGAILVLITTIFSVQRHPDLFRPNGRLVDRQRNVSLWSRYSFHWGADVLAAASKEKFESTDMPAMDHAVRSEDVVARFRNIVIKEDSLPLWVQIFWAFSWELILQWLGILFSNFFDVAPAFATLQLLQYLENRQDIDAIEPGAWKYVAGIVAATVSSFIVDSRLMWWVLTGMSIPKKEICHFSDSYSTGIYLPLRSVLTGLVYAKMLKVKDLSKPPEEVSYHPIVQIETLIGDSH